MMPSPDLTHAPEAASWVESANLARVDFPVQNLPFGLFRSEGTEGRSIGVGIGDSILNLKAAESRGSFRDLELAISSACRQESLNELIALDSYLRTRLRHRLFSLLEASADSLTRQRIGECIVASRSVTMELPARIPDYTDFYTSIFHAMNVGRIFRPKSPLRPNYKWIPIGYHGRVSSIVVSGTEIRRPRGQTSPDQTETPVFGPSCAVDYEVEVGAYVSLDSRLGEPILMREAESHIFGYCLVNDWSARDIQAWEYQPLGPFLSKSFATSISPWIVTAEALAPYRCSEFQRPPGDPRPLTYLDSKFNRERGGIDVTLEVRLTSQKMREQKIGPILLSRGSLRDMYWTFAQLLVHQSSNGCNLRSGDLLASGTLSGRDPGSQGCLLEITRGGAERLTLPTGETRVFLEDGDEVILRGWCEGARAVRIGFGECRGILRGTLKVPA